MTVIYTHEVATVHGFGNYIRLLFRWRGSIYKLVYPDLIVYMLLYFGLSFLYRFGLTSKDQKNTFESIVRYCGDYGSMIPLSFVLGFYVSQIVTRWWAQFTGIPWPDAIAAIISTRLLGTDERSRLMRRTILRYVNLTFTMVMVMISSPVQNRFPTLEHLVEAGFMQPHEKEIIEKLYEKNEHPKFWVPLIWAGSIASTARAENRIPDDMSLNLIVKRLTQFRSDCGSLLNYDWVCVPLVYTQVVTLAVYMYFASSLFGKQFLKGSEEIDLYVPIFLFLEYFFYMGWLKVAETMVNPFGADDDDFEVNWMIDRHFTVSFQIVDEMHEMHPELVKDQYWDEVVPDALPYTQAAAKYKTKAHVGSAQHDLPQQGERRHDLIGMAEQSVMSIAEQLRRPFGSKHHEDDDMADVEEVAKNYETGYYPTVPLQQLNARQKLQKRLHRTSGGSQDPVPDSSSHPNVLPEYTTEQETERDAYPKPPPNQDDSQHQDQ